MIFTKVATHHLFWFAVCFAPRALAQSPTSSNPGADVDTTVAPSSLAQVSDNNSGGDDDDDICTLLPDHDKLEQRLRYSTFQVACPEVGKRVNVEFEFRKTLREPDPDVLSITKSSIAVSGKLYSSEVRKRQ